ncbi:MAG: hypothetical protein LWW88_01080 [Acinetobacter sp.]|uniref:hypothetical protein n=1 Tax=Acinetobacter sp. TaxID=472 RepID=UPI0025902131|nr:hypothetical protein [Acinetobacter sp.]MCE1270162.1 hypothetical protein [Acinetobacter sp.]
MNNILNAQEAFAALQKGKTVLCRYAGNGNLHADKNFSTLDQMPATVFVLPNYEFCVQVEMLELAGIKFTKPLTIDEIEQGQDVFLIQPHAVILQYKFNENIDELVDGIHSGFVQRDFENAQLQYKAFCEAVGGTPIQVNLELAEQPKKKRSRKSTEQNETSESKQQTNDDTSLDDILGPIGIQSPSPNTADPELSVLCDAFVDEINAAVSSEEIKAIRTRINSNGDLTEVESAELATRINLKSASFEKEQSPVPFENIAAAAVAQAKKVDEETQEREWTRFHNDKPYLDLGNKSQYEIEYADLSAVVIHAQSSDEANSVVEKTHHWTTDQRKPLLSLISKRLCELQEQSKVQPKEPPSLMVQIQNAPDLTALDALEIDVSARHPDIQPRLMGYVKKRRFELEQQENAANDGDQPS